MFSFMISGERKAKIKEFIDHSQYCPSCKAFDLRVKVFRKYCHLFFIPFIAFGEKEVEIRCNQCTEPIRTVKFKKKFARSTRTPFYLYTLAILIIGLLASLVMTGIVTHFQTKIYVATPKAGDVYLVNNFKEGRSTYFYLRVAKVNGDTVVAYPNSLRYPGSPKHFSDVDYFVEDQELYYTKAGLQQMLEDDEITMARRNYGEEEGFNRVYTINSKE